MEKLVNSTDLKSVGLCLEGSTPSGRILAKEVRISRVYLMRCSTLEYRELILVMLNEADRLGKTLTRTRSCNTDEEIFTIK